MADELKSHPASQQRRRQLRDAGDVAFSPALTAAAVLSVAVLLVLTCGAYGIGRLADFTRLAIGGAVSGDALERLGPEAARAFLWVVAPVAVVALLACVVAQALQTRVLWAPGRITPRLRAVGITASMRDAFGTHGSAVLAHACLVTGGAGLLLYHGLRGLLDRPEAFAQYDAATAALVVGAIARHLLLGLCGLLLVAGGMDALYQWWRRERRLRMSRREVLAELRETEVHPTMKRGRTRTARTLRQRG
jgi:flagellar biosynthetic protein FlhB